MYFSYILLNIFGICWYIIYFITLKCTFLISGDSDANKLQKVYKKFMIINFQVIGGRRLTIKMGGVQASM